MTDATDHEHEILGFSDFATRLGVKPSYVTELRKSGRLVLTDDGKRVMVAKSLRLIADTRAPSHEGVRERHADRRNHGDTVISGVNSQDRSQAPDIGSVEDFPMEPTSDPLAIRRAKAQAEREEAAARKALREEQVELGELLVKDEVVSALSDAVTLMRSRIELLVPELAPQLAAMSSEDQVSVLLRDGIEQTLEDLSRRFSEIGKRG